MTKVILGIRYGLYMVWFGIQGAFISLGRKIKGKDYLKEYMDKCVMNWCKFTFNVLKMNVYVEGEENIPDKACCFIGNHQSILDIPVILYSANRIIGFVAKRELLKVPVIGGWMKRSNSVALDRDDVRAAIDVINRGVDNLKNGYSMAIFPEGTRSKDGKMGEFKKGSFKLATKAKATIVPFTITGIGKVLVSGEKVKETKIIIKYHKPIDCSQLSREELKVLPKTVEDIVRNN